MPLRNISDYQHAVDLFLEVKEELEAAREARMKCGEKRPEKPISSLTPEQYRIEEERIREGLYKKHLRSGLKKNEREDIRRRLESRIQGVMKDRWHAVHEDMRQIKQEYEQKLAAWWGEIQEFTCLVNSLKEDLNTARLLMQEFLLPIWELLPWLPEDLDNPELEGHTTYWRGTIMRRLSIDPDDVLSLSQGNSTVRMIDMPSFMPGCDGLEFAREQWIGLSFARWGYSGDIVPKCERSDPVLIRVSVNNRVWQHIGWESPPDELALSTEDLIGMPMDIFRIEPNPEALEESDKE